MQMPVPAGAIRQWRKTVIWCRDNPGGPEHPHHLVGKLDRRAGIYFGKLRPSSCKQYDRNGNVLLCNSFSKSLAPGYRVGWTIPGKYKERVLRLKLNHSVSSATLPQAAIAHFLENGRYEHHMRNLRKMLHTQCLRYQQAIADYFPEDTCVSRPQGGYVLWLELNQSVNTIELYEQAFRRKVSFAPGRIFSLQDRYNNCLRISYANPWSKQVEDGLKLIGKTGGADGVMIKVVKFLYILAKNRQNK